MGSVDGAVSFPASPRWFRFSAVEPSRPGGNVEGFFFGVIDFDFPFRPVFIAFVDCRRSQSPHADAHRNQCKRVKGSFFVPVHRFMRLRIESRSPSRTHIQRIWMDPEWFREVKRLRDERGVPPTRVGLRPPGRRTARGCRSSRPRSGAADQLDLNGRLIPSKPHLSGAVSSRSPRTGSFNPPILVVDLCFQSTGVLQLVLSARLDRRSLIRWRSTHYAPNCTIAS